MDYIILYGFHDAENLEEVYISYSVSSLHARPKPTMMPRPTMTSYIDLFWLI